MILLKEEIQNYLSHEVYNQVWDQVRNPDSTYNNSWDVFWNQAWSNVNDGIKLQIRDKVILRVVDPVRGQVDEIT